MKAIIPIYEFMGSFIYNLIMQEHPCLYELYNPGKDNINLINTDDKFILIKDYKHRGYWVKHENVIIDLHTNHGEDIKFNPDRLLVQELIDKGKVI